MEIYKTQSQIAAKHNWLLSLVLLVLITFGALALLQGLAVLLVPYLFEIPVEELPALFMGNLDHPNGRMAILFLQGFGGGLGFFAGGFIFVRYLDKADLGWKQQFHKSKFNLLLLIIPLLLGFMMFNVMIIDWNSSIQFPSFMKAFEEFARAKEDQLMELTRYLTDFSGMGEFLMGLLVIGILAGIGEEYLFRGILQPKLHHYTGNAHAGIWISAIIFSAIHLQFYGFFPRLFLGALFGYLYLYSGSLVYPMLAHILNNSLTVIMIYANKLGMVEFDIENTDNFSWLSILFGLALFILCFKVFIEQTRKETYNEKMAKGI
ncbi:CPBP family intramembrane metalloprotease [Echinicola jeungdonensis]|uniref:Lysostaphin resistance A-like protein n=1 Tax=Echinicola jeungdonensis TaxID=709343 RepID=A0ABV5J6L9_9BACT|nr:CPBP family intramembrane glutamic endopeptidase [Echinicola jeungdonensis]MDN3668849.1 CPBP family intramembrane metalloprotease [Echinicola jeungdonensis]